MNLGKRNTYFTPERDMAFPIVDSINSMAQLMVLSGQQLVELQSAFLDFTLANSGLSRDNLPAVKRNGNPALLNPLLYAQAGVRKNVEMARIWWDIATQTQGAMLAAMRGYAPGRSGGYSARSHRPAKTVIIPERRTTATVLNFPDRRRTSS